MEEETVFILLLLKPMTKTSQLNDIAIMIHTGGCPVLRLSIPCFVTILMKHENEKKEIVLLLKRMTKTSQLNGKSKEDVFRRVFSPKWHFKMVA